MSNEIQFDNCQHEWRFQIDAANSGFPASRPWQSFFICEKCKSSTNMQEKCALDQIQIEKESLKIQERHTKIGMWANILLAITLIDLS